MFGLLLICLFSLFTSSLFAQFIQVGPTLDGNAPNDNFGFSVALSANGRILALGGFKHSASRNTSAGLVNFIRQRKTLS